MATGGIAIELGGGIALERCWAKERRRERRRNENGQMGSVEE
jgi:hypothetical protein